MKLSMNRIRFFIILLLLSDRLSYPCSIVGYLGDNFCSAYIEQGLDRLEYRGYDSAGFACLNDNQDLVVLKAEGKLEKLKEKLKKDPIDGHVGIGHTRWATHGAATETNAHPQTGCGARVAVVHNGIIENHYQLREQLKAQGHVFKSETDTEVLPHLLEDCLDNNQTLKDAALELIGNLKGSFAFLALMTEQPDTILAVRKSSPMCVGLGTNEMFIASDFLGFAGKTNQVVFLPDESFALITKDSIELYNFDGQALPVVIKTLDITPTIYDKFQHEHYMLKEIYEQRNAIHAAVNHYKSLGDGVWEQLGISAEYARDLKSVHMFGCGTSWHAARIAQFFFEIICGVPAAAHLASEFRYMPFFTSPNCVYVAISQSGETADTLEALRMINLVNIPVVTLTNVPSSTMAREALGHLPLKAGPEIAVASTKAFTTQITALYWLAHYLALTKGIITQEEMTQAEQNLFEAADALQAVIDTYRLSIIQTHAKKYAQAKRFMYLGRHIGYPFAMEGALKLKEISYIFAQGYPAGELKHGSIALVDLETPTLIFSHLDPVIYQKLVSNAQEVKARKGHLIAFVFEGQEELIKIADQSFIIPRVAPLLEPLVMAGLMQFFAYQVAKELGHDIDKPRNLAKAVTVE
ncbi:MAG: glutamine--fructose-6-phosphate transaminase (isomerizing) [Candidatus Dependentiae bacterium]|nr:glutamine--fructose-6-phosphate transaminase (isomerizing) [Candidatus Dependentiae bacterium]